MRLDGPGKEPDEAHTLHREARGAFTPRASHVRTISGTAQPVTHAIRPATGTLSGRHWACNATRGGQTAVLRFFTKGLIIVNASDPTQDIEVDLSGNALFKGQEQGAFGYYDHFDGKSLAAGTTQFRVPAAYYPLADVHTNSARVFSYVDKGGKLIGG